MQEGVIRCECGHVIRGTDEAQLVADAQRHALDVHGMRLAREQVLAMVRPA